MNTFEPKVLNSNDSKYLFTMKLVNRNDSKKELPSIFSNNNKFSLPSTPTTIYEDTLYEDDIESKKYDDTSTLTRSIENNVKNKKRIQKEQNNFSFLKLKPNLFDELIKAENHFWKYKNNCSRRFLIENARNQNNNLFMNIIS